MKHAPAPGMSDPIAWCSLRHHYIADDYEDDSGCRATVTYQNKPVTHQGVVRCPECIELLCAYPQYYNALRAQGLRTEAEAEHEHNV